MGSIMKSFFLFRAKQVYLPGRIGVFFNPSYIIRRRLYQNILKLSDNLCGNVLDFGCGTSPYKSLFKNVEMYVRMDHKDSEVLTFDKEVLSYDGDNIPGQNAGFDGVICTEVLEHIKDPDKILGEFNRVLKTGGVLLLTTPFLWEEHAHPYDFRRYTLEGLSAQLSAHNFEILAANKSSGYFESLIQMKAQYWTKTFSHRNFWVNLMLQSVFISPFMIWGLLLSKIFPANDKLYLNNIILAKKLK